MKSVLFLTSAGVVSAWWDSGHMITAAIAKKLMKPEDVDMIETILSRWDAEFPNMGTMAVASTWLDHVKCENSNADYCRGLENSDGNPFYYNFHFNDVLYNPENLSLTKVDDLAALLDVSKHGAGNFLNGAYKVLSRSINASASTSNLALRGILHILGDIHQPLHTFTALCRWKFDNKVAVPPREDMIAALGGFDFVDKSTDKNAPNAVLDNGGNGVQIYFPEDPNIRNLHALWDAAGGLYKTSWPQFSEQDALTVADELLARKDLVPESQDLAFEGTNGMTHWITESSGKFAEAVYSEVISTCASGHNFLSKKMKMSDKYVKFVQDLSRQRLVLGGHRMAQVLTKIAESRRADSRKKEQTIRV